MNNKLLLLTLLCIFCISANAQNFEKIWLNKTDSVYGYYTIIKPLSNRIQGVMVLMDGYGGNASDFLTETKLHNIACTNDILTVCLPEGLHLYADTATVSLISNVLSDVATSYKVKKDQFVFGGFSAGGSILLRYAELCKEHPENYPVSPKAVFTVDSPVDLLGLYRSSQADLKDADKSKGWWLGEAQMIIDTFDNAFGKPEAAMQHYRKASPFIRTDSTEGNEKYLKDIAYRTYHDVDVKWYLQNRFRSLYQTNMLDASELVKRLLLMGNNNAEFVASKTPGVRSNGYRHPHAWSIVDEVELIQWVKMQLNFYPEHIAQPYAYNVPEKWSPELIMFPIDFAPALPYNGFEDLRFAPGWGDKNSNERWAYTILWWLDGNYTFTEKSLQQDLESYFNGLTKRRSIADKLDMALFTNAKAQAQKIKTNVGDVSTYTATVNIFDAQVTQKPGTLHIKIHIKTCIDNLKTIVLFEISALPFDQQVWQQLDGINEAFKCEKK
ncbi:hypothetical protein BH11BAC6_BH11BAC6_17730 [soil metagenome]